MLDDRRLPADQAAAKADLHQLLACLIKVALVGDAGDVTAWRAEALDLQHGLAAANVDSKTLFLDGIWTSAVKTAERDPVVQRDETVNPVLPASCPIALDRLTGDHFDLDGVLQSIRNAASFG